MASTLAVIAPFGKMTPSCAWATCPMCWLCSTTPPGVCLLVKVTPICLRLNALLPLSLTVLWLNLPVNVRNISCNSPAARGARQMLASASFERAPPCMACGEKLCRPTALVPQSVLWRPLEMEVGRRNTPEGLPQASKGSPPPTRIADEPGSAESVPGSHTPIPWATRGSSGYSTCWR